MRSYDDESNPELDDYADDVALWLRNHYRRTPPQSVMAEHLATLQTLETTASRFGTPTYRAVFVAACLVVVASASLLTYRANDSGPVTTDTVTNRPVADLVDNSIDKTVIDTPDDLSLFDDRTKSDGGSIIASAESAFDASPAGRNSVQSAPPPASVGQNSIAPTSASPAVPGQSVSYTTGPASPTTNPSPASVPESTTVVARPTSSAPRTGPIQTLAPRTTLRQTTPPPRPSTTSTIRPQTTPTSDATPPPIDQPTCNGLVATIVGGNGGQVITGTAGPDVIVGGNGRDTIYGLGGDDIICGGNGRDTLFGGEGDDTLIGGHGPDRLEGGPGANLLID